MHEFEKQWQKRFESFAKRSSDAQIAGWSQTGLEARLFFFNQHIQTAHGLWIDAGSGAGTYTRLLASKGADVIGFDYSFLSLKKAKQQQGEFICADAYKIPIKSSVAAGCLCFGVLQALEDDKTLVDQLSTILKSDGQLWLDGLNQFCVVHLIKQFKNKLTGKAKHLRYTNPWHIKNQLKQFGFKTIDLYWAPILPGRLSRLNGFLLRKSTQKWLKLFGFMTVFLSHSYYLHGVKAGD